MRAYLHFKAGLSGPFQTVAAPACEKLLPWQAAGLTWTATGYGRKIPTRYLVYFDGRWRRVYSTHYANAGTAWVYVDGKEVTVSDIERTGGAS